MTHPLVRSLLPPGCFETRTLLRIELGELSLPVRGPPSALSRAKQPYYASRSDSR